MNYCGDMLKQREMAVTCKLLLVSILTHSYALQCMCFVGNIIPHRSLAALLQVSPQNAIEAYKEIISSHKNQESRFEPRAIFNPRVFLIIEAFSHFLHQTHTAQKCIYLHCGYKYQQEDNMKNLPCLEAEQFLALP